MQVAYLVQAQCAAMPSLNLSAFVASWLDKRLNKSLNRRTFEARQLRKFRALAHILRARSPYYARIMDERRIEPARCRPQDFPVLTKADVIQHFDEIITAPEVTKRAVTDFLSQSHDAAELFRGRYIIVHSSGTTGEPGCFVYSSGSGAGEERRFAISEVLASCQRGDARWRSSAQHEIILPGFPSCRRFARRFSGRFLNLKAST